MKTGWGLTPKGLGVNGGRAKVSGGRGRARDDKVTGHWDKSWGQGW